MVPISQKKACILVSCPLRRVAGCAMAVGLHHSKIWLTRGGGWGRCEEALEEGEAESEVPAPLMTVVSTIIRINTNFNDRNTHHCHTQGKTQWAHLQGRWPQTATATQAHSQSLSPQAQKHKFIAQTSNIGSQRSSRSIQDKKDLFLSRSQKIPQGFFQRRELSPPHQVHTTKAQTALTNLTVLPRHFQPQELSGLQREWEGKGGGTTRHTQIQAKERERAEQEWKIEE